MAAQPGGRHGPDTAQQARIGPLHGFADARTNRQLRIRRPPQRLRAAARRRRQTAGRRPDHRPHAGLLVRVPLHQLQNRAADTDRSGGGQPRKPRRSTDQTHADHDHLRTEILHADAPLDQLRRILLLGEGRRRHPTGTGLPKRQRHSQIRQQRTVVVPVVDRYAETVDLRRARRIRDHIYFRRRRLAMAVSRRRARRPAQEGRFQHLRRFAARAARRAAYSDRIAVAAGVRGLRILL